MSQKVRIKYTPVAIDDMDEIFSYISDENYYAAETMLEKINAGILRLAEFPNLGSVLPEDKYSLIQYGYRFIIVHPYLVFYRISDDIIVIYRILHGRRDYLRELFDL